MKLLFDEMLKRAATWCRILGIESEYFTDKSDSELLEHAKGNDLTLVTRDVQLAARCKKHGVRCIFVESNVAEEQVAQIIKESGAAISFPEKTLCPVCNGRLDTVSPESLKGEIPEDVFSSGKKVWRCKECKKAYWEGSHWRNIEKFYQRIKRLLR
jgi:uncharacterized protein with PIN domain